MGEDDRDDRNPAASDRRDPDDGETLRAVLRGVGASLLLTDARLILVRDRAGHRPMSGVQTVTIDRIGQIAIELGTGQSGRVVVHDLTRREWSSVFFDARSVDRARALVDLARPMIARARRRRVADGDGDPS
jgi:hypothetical protein